MADCCFLITRYDHLSEVLSKILDERPNHCVGKLVSKSKQVKIECI